ncbi:MAG: hypothetical protein QHJ34_09000 [bacterium]|jgi:hypothetical protein|nr:hypothetical protein [candidate division KSB1 bacterium]MDH7560352.1 hypothetical protein [bacterium]
MRPLLRPLLVALALHLLAALILLAVRLPSEKPGELPEVTLLPTPLQEGKPPAVRRPVQVTLRLPASPVTAREALPAARDTLRQASAVGPRPAEVLRAATDSLRLQAARRWALFHRPLPDSLFAPTAAEALAERLARYGPPVGDTRLLPPRDRAGEELYRRATGHGGLTDLGALLRKVGVGRAPSSQAPTRISREPTFQELHVLKELWSAKSLMAPELYRQLDPAIAPSAESLNQLLDEMTERGLLRRRLVSPQDVLTVTTPFGSMEVERNQLNLRNRVYRYWPAVGREELLHYLQGALLREEASDSSEHARRLAEKLRLLVVQE